VCEVKQALQIRAKGTTMKIWRFHEFGPIQNLKLEEAPIPKLGPGEALIKLHYAAINPADRFLVAKLYPRPGTPPLAVGRDGCGTVVEVAEPAGAAGTPALKPGDRVMLLRSEVGVRRDGSLAEYVAVPVESLAPVPEGWTDQEAAAGGLVQLTAWQALVTEGGLAPRSGGAAGKNVLVSGASGGVGTAAVMQAKALGARVVALSRSQAKRQRLLEIGADFVFDGDDPELVAKVKAALGGQVDVVVDNLGGPYMDAYIAMAGFRARICTVGMLAGVNVTFNIGKMIFKRIHICGIAVGSQTPAEARANFDALIGVLAQAGSRPLVDRVFPFEQVQEAFAHLERGPMGKVVVGPMNG
jgi:NADPH2:quinone reductase